MKMRNVIHKGLRRFIERNEPGGLPPASIEKVRNIVTFLLELEDIQELRDLPHWNAQQLTGNRKGTWSLSVTRNRRITFSVDQKEGELFDLDFEDYH
jgi:proteic killer suppression protein